jgi:hypothetical protein
LPISSALRCPYSCACDPMTSTMRRNRATRSSTDVRRHVSKAVAARSRAASACSSVQASRRWTTSSVDGLTVQ